MMVVGNVLNRAAIALKLRKFISISLRRISFADTTFKTDSIFTPG